MPLVARLICLFGPRETRTLIQVSLVALIVGALLIAGEYHRLASVFGIVAWFSFVWFLQQTAKTIGDDSIAALAKRIMTLTVLSILGSLVGLLISLGLLVLGSLAAPLIAKFPGTWTVVAFIASLVSGGLWLVSFVLSLAAFVIYLYVLPMLIRALPVQLGASTAADNGTSFPRKRGEYRQAIESLKAVGVKIIPNYQNRRISIGFGRGSKITDEFLALLPSLGLSELYLARTGISDIGVEHLRHLKSLSVLDVSHTEISHDGLQTQRGIARHGDSLSSQLR